MRWRKRVDVGTGLLAMAAAAELAIRLLSPRERLPAPAPVDVRRYFSEEEIRRGTRFAKPQRLIGTLNGAVGLGALTFVVRSRPRILARLPGPPALAGALAGSGLSVALTLPGLPLSAVARHRAMRVGLVTQPWRGWAGDLVKATAIEAALSAAGGAGIVALTRRLPRGWWAAAGLGSAVFGAGLATLAPVVLDPVFNDFTPLPEGETRSDVLELAQAAGVRVGEVYSVDASRRTTAANAYVTGLGPTKRVVLFDTLLDRYDRQEVRVVVAHELAHVRHRDVNRGLAFAALIAAPAAFSVQRLSWLLSPERGTAAALPALTLAAGLVVAPVGLLGARLSRALERRADLRSLEWTGATDAFISFERSISLQNLADLEPPRLTRMLASHPPTTERIGMAVTYATGGRWPFSFAPVTPGRAPDRRTPEGS